MAASKARGVRTPVSVEHGEHSHSPRPTGVFGRVRGGHRRLLKSRARFIVLNIGNSDRSGDGVLDRSVGVLVFCWCRDLAYVRRRPVHLHSAHPPASSSPSPPCISYRLGHNKYLVDMKISHPCFDRTERPVEEQRLMFRQNCGRVRAFLFVYLRCCEHAQKHHDNSGVSGGPRLFDPWFDWEKPLGLP